MAKYFLALLIVVFCSVDLYAGKSEKGLTLVRFTVVDGGKTFKAVVFKSDKGLLVNEVWEAAERLGLKKPPVSLAQVIRDKFTDDEIRSLGFWYLVVMHKPLKHQLGDDMNYTTMSKDGSKALWLTFSDPDTNWWNENTGFVFIE